MKIDQMQLLRKLPAKYYLRKFIQSVIAENESYRKHLYAVKIFHFLKL